MFIGLCHFSSIKVAVGVGAGAGAGAGWAQPGLNLIECIYYKCELIFFILRLIYYIRIL